MLSIKGVRRPRLPYLVLEVGYLESYVELLKDARTWLMDYDKEVLAVILIKVTAPRQPWQTIGHDLMDWRAFVEVWERDL